MKLLTNRHSPYGRKAVATVHELNLTDVAIEHEETSPTKKNTAVSDHNPLGKIPILLTNDAGPIFDSDVICQYLCQL
ncbi:MAG: glutathione S-transferase N-terminal domain-containing protein, partial [Planctomycetota bacterium]